jgi:DNA-binding winged helix-turn-helix (wHTH) protein
MSDIEAQPETTQFGPFLLDRRRRLLLSGGKPVKIGTMQFDLLAYLIDHRDQAPTRDDITAHVWRGLAVGTNSLSVQLSALRKVLAENGGDERLIITLPGQLRPMRRPRPTPAHRFHPRRVVAAWKSERASSSP